MSLFSGRYCDLAVVIVPALVVVMVDLSLFDFGLQIKRYPIQVRC